MIKIITIVFFSFAFGLAQDATSIVKKAEQLMRANSSYTEMTMTIIKPNWSREMTMKVWALEPDYALVYIEAPAKDKGTVTLKRKKEVWNWIPAVNWARISPMMIWSGNHRSLSIIHIRLSVKKRWLGMTAIKLK